MKPEYQSASRKKPRKPEKKKKKSNAYLRTSPRYYKSMKLPYQGTRKRMELEQMSVLWLVLPSNIYIAKKIGN